MLSFVKPLRGPSTLFFRFYLFVIIKPKKRKTIDSTCDIHTIYMTYIYNVSSDYKGCIVNIYN